MDFGHILFTWSSGEEVKLIDLLFSIGLVILGQTIVVLMNKKLLSLMFTASKQQKEDRTKMRKYTRFFINLLVLILLVEVLKVPTNFLSYSIGLSTEETGAITIGKIINVILIIYMAGGIAWLSKKFILIPFFNSKKLDKGRQYALLQFSMYVVYTLAAVVALSEIMRDITILAGAFAGLAVGLGLGLQQTFNDLISGIIMLVEGTVEINDTVLVDGAQAKVRKIGLRISTLETPDNMVWLVPNSKLVVDKVLNWSHNNSASRFYIDVGVAYGTKQTTMQEIWQTLCEQEEAVLRFPEPSLMLMDFADYSIKYRLLFYSNNFHEIEGLKSTLRIKLLDAFDRAGVEIPYPKQIMITKGS